MEWGRSLWCSSGSRASHGIRLEPSIYSETTFLPGFSPPHPPIYSTSLTTLQISPENIPQLKRESSVSGPTSKDTLNMGRLSVNNPSLTVLSANMLSLLQFLVSLLLPIQKILMSPHCSQLKIQTPLDSIQSPQCLEFTSLPSFMPCHPSLCLP